MGIKCQKRFKEIHVMFILMTTYFAIKNIKGWDYTLSSYDVASGSEITPCNKMDKPLVVYRFTGNVITSITTIRT